MTSARLIVDVGMHRGDDTDFYLRKGFRVLAIEADPQLVAQAGERFRHEVETGRLEILNLAVADRKGSLPFHVSSREGWGSLVAGRAGVATGAEVRTVTVPADTFDSIMKTYATPHYVKVDIEGADAMCINALCRMPALPAYVSFEADVGSPEGGVDLVAALADVGYTGFKVVNQALNPELVCPFPATEGDYVDSRFTHEMSGLFGSETAGRWSAAHEIRTALRELGQQQRFRTRFATTGRVSGVPLGRLYGPLRSVYNSPPVASARSHYARMRRREVGGWFDVHARLSEESVQAERER